MFIDGMLLCNIHMMWLQSYESSRNGFCEMDFAKWILEFLGVKGVHFYGKFGLGIPRNSLEFPIITTLVLKT